MSRARAFAALSPLVAATLLQGGCAPLDRRPTRGGPAGEEVFVRVRYQGGAEAPDPVTEDQFLQAARHVVPGATGVAWGIEPPPGQCGVDLVVGWTDRLEERAPTAGGVNPTAQAVVYWTRTYTVEAVIRTRWGAVASAGQGTASGTMSFAREVPLGTPLAGADAFSNARWLALRRCLDALRVAWNEHPHDPPRPRFGDDGLHEVRDGVREEILRRRRRTS